MDPQPSYPYYTDLVITWDPIEFEVNRHLPKYEESNVSITYL